MASYADISQPFSGQTSFMGGSLDPGGVGDPSFYWNAIPEAGYYAHLGRQGLTGTDPASRWAQSQYSRYYDMYQADAAKNPNQGFYDWYLGKGINPGQDFANLDPRSRGDNTSSTLAPRARWTF